MTDPRGEAQGKVLLCRIFGHRYGGVLHRRPRSMDWFLQCERCWFERPPHWQLKTDELHSRDYFHEAANTMKANGWTLFLANLFGEKVVGFDTALNTMVEMRRWNGVTYMIRSHQEAP